MQQATHTTLKINSFKFSSAINLKKFLTQADIFCRQHQTRKQLKKLTDAQLADIGISRKEAEQEAKRPFWQ